MWTLLAAAALAAIPDLDVPATSSHTFASSGEICQSFVPSLPRLTEFHFRGGYGAPETSRGLTLRLIEGETASGTVLATGTETDVDFDTDNLVWHLDAHLVAGNRYSACLTAQSSIYLSLRHGSYANGKLWTTPSGSLSGDMAFATFGEGWWWQGWLAGVPDGTASLAVSMRTAPSGGDVLWSETVEATVADGIASFDLGVGTPLPASVLDPAARVWLEIANGTTKLTAVPLRTHLGGISELRGSGSAAAGTCDLSAWGATSVTATPSSGWTSSGLSATRVGGTIYTQGQLTGSSWSVLAMVGSPPSKTSIFDLQTSAGRARIDLRNDGSVRWTTGSKGSSVSLSGLAWSEAAATDLAMASGWSAYGGSYQVPSSTLDGSLVRLRGLTRGDTKTPGTIATLPEGRHPKARRVFLANLHGATARVDVMPDGAVSLVVGGSIGWVSLDGIAFPIGTGDALSLATGWASYGSSYTVPEVQRRGDVVALGGLLRSSGGGALLTTLDAADRPAGTLAFGVSSSSGPARVEVGANGEVRVVGAIPGWISLDGIHFVRDPDLAARTATTARACAAIGGTWE